MIILRLAHNLRYYCRYSSSAGTVRYASISAFSKWVRFGCHPFAVVLPISQVLKRAAGEAPATHALFGNGIICSWFAYSRPLSTCSHVMIAQNINHIHGTVVTLDDHVQSSHWMASAARRNPT